MAGRSSSRGAFCPLLHNTRGCGHPRLIVAAPTAPRKKMFPRRTSYTHVMRSIEKTSTLVNMLYIPRQRRATGTWATRCTHGRPVCKGGCGVSSLSMLHRLGISWRRCLQLNVVLLLRAVGSLRFPRCAAPATGVRRCCQLVHVFGLMRTKLNVSCPDAAQHLGLEP